MHKSGFINIIGKPNVGKSTLMNALMKEKLSIITSKPQTTRHRILGILSDESYQAVFSDSPGIIDEPKYGLQKSLNKFAFSSFEDADILIFVIDLFEQYTGEEPEILSLQKTESVKFLVINKVDLDKEGKLELIKEKWANLLSFDKLFCISALNKEGVDELRDEIIDALPEGPVYFDKDQLSDKPERFFVSEIVRAQLLQLYKQEIPYSCEVVVEQFKDEISRKGPILRISALIYVERETQKAIILGHKGTAIKRLGIEARKEIEEFFGKHVHLELYVKVKENWRDEESSLRNFGYEH